MDRVLGPPEYDPPVPVAERDKVSPRRDAGLCQQAERQLDTALVIDVKFGWFPEHEESVALSLSEDVDRLGLQSWPELAGHRISCGSPLRRGSIFVVDV
ncbi:hypothetical protein ACFYO2_28880 [Streptomyces sp. NPDC006602]|uniref:hypothetical protein n=1 Tax=Streptomyces sp. NPDC006602 TaxID=3364751 RepID=UPI0036855B33